MCTTGAHYLDCAQCYLFTIHHSTARRRAGFFHGTDIMPQRFTIPGWFTMLVTHPPDAMRIAFILILGEAGRWLLGGGRIREALGDLIICLLIFYLIRPHIMSLPPVLGVQLSPGQVAIIISLLGSRVIKGIFAWAFEKKTGLKLEKK